MRVLGKLQDQLECMRVKPLLQAFLDGELGDEEAARVARHLEACHRCGLAADTYTQIKQGLGHLGQEPDREAVQRLTRFVDDLDRKE